MAYKLYTALCVVRLLKTKNKTIAVRYKQDRPTSKGINVLVELPKDIRMDEDAFWDFSHDYITEMLGDEPKWISLIGKVLIDKLEW